MNNMLLSIFGSGASKVLGIAVAILFFGFIIFIHELGHFIFAKLFGVKVNEFALGMGPTIFKKQGKTTKYALRLFPIGGFVSMEGEDEESENENAFCNKAVYKRMIIVAAGGVFNILLGVVVCCFLVGSQDYVGTNRILQFYDSAVSNGEGGLMENDKILTIDGKRVYSDYDISFLMQRNSSGVYSITVERDLEKLELDSVTFAKRTSGNFSYDENLVISELSSAIESEGLEAGDRIVAVNSVEVSTAQQLISAINADEDYIIDFKVERNQGIIDVEDVEMSTVTVFDFVLLGEEKNVFNVLGGGIKYAVSMSRMVYLSLFDLLRGHYGLNELAGPVGTVSVIADIAQDSAQAADYTSLFTIMALITINLGLFNLLPVPALDGGRFFFMLIELIFRRPIPQKYEGWIHAVGLIILLGFMLIVSASDIWKLISGKGFY